MQEEEVYKLIRRKAWLSCVGAHPMGSREPSWDVWAGGGEGAVTLWVPSWSVLAE